MSYTPLIIIGAGRSGTNMLRDIIINIDGFETWDCDEINPIWRHGNRNFSTDILKPEHATKRVRNYIQKRFDQLQKQTNAKFVVEKTCANSLRLEYVHEIFPNAKFIIINRDGRDVVLSAMKRWNSKLDLRYTLKKIRYVPLIDMFYYISKFGFNRVKRFFKREESLSFWGPIYDGISQDVEKLSLMEVCANQWKHCVKNTNADRKLVPEANILDIRYEEFVNDPISDLKRIAQFCDVELSLEDMKDLTKKVSKKSVGSHKKGFSKEEQKKLNEITKETLLSLGIE